MASPTPTSGTPPPTPEPGLPSTVPATPSLTLFGGVLSIDMVDIYVGPAKKHYRVHKAVICKVDYFREMFTKGFKETIEQVAKLPEVDIMAFEFFLEWIYRGTFHHSLSVVFVVNNDPTPIIKLHGWAELICLSDFMDYTAAVLFSMHLKLKQRFSVCEIKTVYQSTPPESVLRPWAIQALRHTSPRSARPIAVTGKALKLCGKNPC